MSTADWIVDAFGPGDITAARKLSDTAGWNQVDADWGRLVKVEPEGCLCVRDGDRLLGTTTYITYGEDLAWIGMVLVDPSHRRCGIARSLMRAAMAAISARQIEAVGLDATGFGRPLYERMGFVPAAQIIRWKGSLRQGFSDLDPIGRDDLEMVCRFDRKCCGYDRSKLLKQLIGEPEVRVLALFHRRTAVKSRSTAQHRTINGYTVVRPGRNAWHIGPIVAGRKEDVRILLEGAARQVGMHEVVIDSVEEAGFGTVIEQAGLRPHRRLVRMTIGPGEPLLITEKTAAAAGFEWG